MCLYARLFCFLRERSQFHATPSLSKLSMPFHVAEYAGSRNSSLTDVAMYSIRRRERESERASQPASERAVCVSCLSRIGACLAREWPLTPVGRDRCCRQPRSQRLNPSSARQRPRCTITLYEMTTFRTNKRTLPIYSVLSALVTYTIHCGTTQSR